MSHITFCNHCPLTQDELRVQLKSIESTLRFLSPKRVTPEQRVTLKVLVARLEAPCLTFLVDHLHTGKTHQCLIRLDNLTFYFTRPLSYAELTPETFLLQLTKFVVHPDPQLDQEIEEFHNSVNPISERHEFVNYPFECLATRSASSVHQALEALNISTTFPRIWRSQNNDDEISHLAAQYLHEVPQALFLDCLTDRENFEVLAAATIDTLRIRIRRSNNQILRARLLQVVSILTRLQRSNPVLVRVVAHPTAILYVYTIAAHKVVMQETLLDEESLADINDESINTLLDNFVDDGYSSEMLNLSVTHKLDSSDLTSTILSSLKTLMLEPTVYQLVAGFVSNFLILMRNFKDPITVGLSIVNILLNFKISYALALKAADSIKVHLFQVIEFFTSFHAQSVDAYNAFKSMAMPIVATLITFLSVVISSKLPDQKMINDALMRMSSFGRAIAGFEKTYAFLGEWIAKAFDICYSKVAGLPKEALEMEPYIADVDKYFKDIQDVLKRSTFDDISTNPDLCDSVETLYKLGLKYSQQLSLLKLTTAQTNPFYVHFRELSKLYTSIVSRGARYFSPRTEPTCIHLYGDSGVGKSGLVFLLSQDLLATEGLEDQVLENVYMRAVEHEYWNGYQGQRICVYDDFGQRTDSSSKPNEEFMEIIRTANIIPMMCHMAEIQDKKSTPFISRALILTSNANSFDIKSLICPTAYKRRRQVVAEVQLVDAYAKYVVIDSKATKRLDKEAIRKGGLPCLADDIYKFHVVSPDTGVGEQVLDDVGNFVKKYITYKEFSQMCQDSYKEQYDDSKERIAYLKERAKKFRAENNDEDRFSLAEIAAVKYFLLNNETEYSAVTNEIKLPKSFDIYTKEQFAGMQCAQIMDHILQHYPEGQHVVPTWPARVLKLATEYYIEGKEFVALASKTSWDHLKNLSSRFSKTLRFKLSDESPPMQHAKLIGRFVVGVCAIITGWAVYNRLTAVKKEITTLWSDESASECAFRDLIADEWTEFTTHRAALLLSSLCANSCEFCDQTREYFGSFTCDATDAAAQVHLATNLYACGTELMYVDAGSESKKYDANRTRSKKFARTERKYDADRTNQKKTNRTEGKKYDAARTNQKRSHRTEVDMTSEAVYDANQQEVIQKKLLKNTYRIYVPSKDSNSEWKPIVNMIFIKSRTAILPTHALARILRAPRIKIRNIFVKEGLLVPTEEIDSRPVMATKLAASIRGKVNLEKDTSMIQFPVLIPMHADITKLFVSNKELATVQSCRATLVTLRDTYDDINYVGHVFNEVVAKDTFTYSHDENGTERTIALRDCWEYNADSVPGDCGSPLVLSSPLIQRKIVGFHVAGCAGKGAATSISCEDLERALGSNGNDWRSHCLTVADYVDQNAQPTLPKGDFIPIGTIGRSLRGNGRTRIRESPLAQKLAYNEGKLATAPAVLHRVVVDGATVDPLEKGLRKCGVQTKLIDQHILNSACVNWSSKLYTNVDPRHRRVFTHEESITGLSNDIYADPINRRSSAGWPWVNSAAGTMGKTKWLGSNEEYILDNPELCAALKVREDNARQRIRTPTYWIDTLKDERRSHEKIAAVKTRVFSAGPMDYVILFRKYFLGFNAHIMKEKIDNEIAVGINVYSQEWARLGQYLQRQGSKVIAGDFSNFDGTLNPQILHKICDIINEWYDDGEENATIRKVLWEEVVSSHHIFENNVYSWTHSQPSGNPATVIINSAYNSISMRVVWLNIMRETAFPSLASFDKYVNMISYGDDNVLNINNKVIDDFNQVTIAKGYADIGMTYTDEAKSGEVVPFRTLSDVKFLKRGFHEIDGTILAPLELDVVMEMCQWVKTDFNTVDNTIANVETALRELSLHPRSIFDAHSKDLISACRRVLPRQPMIYTYEDYRSQDFDQYY